MFTKRKGDSEAKLPRMSLVYKTVVGGSVSLSEKKLLLKFLLNLNFKVIFTLLLTYSVKALYGNTDRLIVWGETLTDLFCFSVWNRG